MAARQSNRSSPGPLHLRAYAPPAPRWRQSALAIRVRLDYVVGVIAKEAKKSESKKAVADERRTEDSAALPGPASSSKKDGEDTRQWFQSLENVLEYAVKNQSPE